MSELIKIEPDKIEKAKKLYMDYVPVRDIARQLGINRSSINHYVYNSWKEERELARLELLDYMTLEKKKDLSTMTQSSIKIISRALESLANQPEPPSIREASKVSEILATLDKITRLDDMKPTDIVSDKPVTIVEIKERLKLDPFALEESEDDEEIIEPS